MGQKRPLHIAARRGRFNALVYPCFLLCFIQGSRADERLKQSTPIQTFSGKSAAASAASSSSSATNQQEMNEDFIVWMAFDLEPCSLVDNRGLRFFFRKHFPQVTIPGESTLKCVYDKVADRVKCDLTAARTISLLLDRWTDRQATCDRLLDSPRSVHHRRLARESCHIVGEAMQA